MLKKICLIIILMTSTAVTAAARKHAPVKKAKTETKHSPANHDAVAAKLAAGEHTLAKIEMTNPFGIVPAAGMEMLGVSDILEEEISDQDNSELVADMLSYARKFLGVRYVRGGKSPKGFDCSGFTSYVFGQFGVNLSRSSREQYTQGTSINRPEVQPGDLLFFKGRSRNARGVGHVAIAIDANPATGEITFIHASSSAGIAIDCLSAPYYAARYLGARRVVGK